MGVTRRGFLAAAGAAPLRGAFGGALATWDAQPKVACVLPESRAGYLGALGRGAGTRPLVLPGAVGWDDSLPWRVRAGATVIFESAAGFSGSGALEEQRAGLWSAFRLEIDDPTEPWKGASSPGYLDLLWPIPAKVRDFSSVVGVRGGEPVGRLGPLPVAALRRCGAGVFLFLGSPVGPALWSGDPEARAWVASIQTLGPRATS
jgi:hypothetical protein